MAVIKPPERIGPRRALLILLAELALILVVAAVPDLSSDDHWDPPCSGENRERCLEPQTELDSISVDSCAGTGLRVCLVPIGTIDPGLVAHLIAYYRDEYGLSVEVLTPSPIPSEIHDSARGQIDGGRLAQHMGELFPDDYSDPDAVLIGLTPVDLYLNTTDWRFIFWAASNEIHKGVVSTFRMNPETFGMRPNDDLLYSRARKVVTRLIGTLYYGLSETKDPESLLYDNVLSVDDLDRMSEKLPNDPH
jgi:predicted Zn-dependent protease